MGEKLLVAFPEAINVRNEGRCDCCHREGLRSFQLPDDAEATDPASDVEHCGYYCERCGFSNAGSRMGKYQHQIETRVAELFSAMFPPGSAGPDARFDIADLYQRAEEELAGGVDLPF